MNSTQALTHQFRTDREARRRAAAPHRVHEKARVVFRAPELLHLILASYFDTDTPEYYSSRQDAAALARAARVCRLWADEVALLLWRLCCSPDTVRRQVSLDRQAVVAGYLRHVLLSSGQQLWTGQPPSMPTFCNIKTIYIRCMPSQLTAHARYLPKLFNAGVTDLSLESSAPELLYVPEHQIISSPVAHRSWLRALGQRCVTLSSLILDIKLPSSAVTDLNHLLLSTSLRKLSLGPLLDDILDDFTVALALAQPSIQDLTLGYPITLEAFKILDQQCHGLPSLFRLMYLQVTCTINAGEVLPLLLSLTPNLTLFYLTLYPSETDKPWVMPTAGFEALTQLQYLGLLAIKFECATNNNVAIRGADLMAIARIPCLVSLQLDTYLPDFNNMLLIREISAADVICLMRQWQRLWCDITLNLWIHKLSCTEAQEQIIRELASTIEDINFAVRTLVLEEDLDLDPEVWLGRNGNFTPDPQEWQSRQLYHPGAEVGRVEAVDDDDEDEYLVWGHEEVKHKRYDW